MRKQLTMKLTTVLLTLAMLLTTVIGSLSVSAAPIVEDGLAGNDGSLEIHKVDGDGKDLGGAEFTLYKIMSLTPGATPGQYATYVVESYYSTQLSGISADDLGNYSATEIQALSASLEARAKTDPNKIVMDETDSDGLSTEENLAYGYYLVVETKAPEGFAAITPFFVAIPSTDNYDNSTESGTAWVYDVKVQPKNVKIPVDKKITNANGDHENGTVAMKDGEGDTVAVGDIVKYQLSTVLPAYTQEYFDNNGTPKFVLYDELSSGLDIVDDDGVLFETIVVKSNEVDLILDTDYTLAYANSGVAGTSDLTVTFSQEFLKETANHNKAITVDYAARVNSEAVIGEVGNPNKAYLEYTNRPGVDAEGEPYEAETPPSEKIVYTYALEILKTEEGKTKELSGAKFELYKADENGDITATQVGDAQTTDDTGIITFSRIDAGVYYLKEVESPAGYTLLTNPIKIRIEEILDAGVPTGGIKFYINDAAVATTANKDGTGNFQSHIEMNDGEQTGVVNITVENKKGFNLPSTGGMGITIFLAVAFVGITTISVILMKKRKGHNNK